MYSPCVSSVDQVGRFINNALQLIIRVFRTRSAGCRVSCKPPSSSGMTFPELGPGPEISVALAYSKFQKRLLSPSITKHPHIYIG